MLRSIYKTTTTTTTNITRTTNHGQANQTEETFSRRRLALGMVLATKKHFTRDREVVASMNSFALEQQLPFFVETHLFEKGWYNKQRMVIKYLPYFDWLLYVDSDTFMTTRKAFDGRQQLLERLAMFERGGYHMAFSEIHFANVGGLDAGVFFVRNSLVGETFIRDWLTYSTRALHNADNGAVNIVLLNTVLRQRGGYDGHCDAGLLKNRTFTVIQSRLQYHGFFNCFYEALDAARATWPYEKRCFFQETDTARKVEEKRKRYAPFYLFGWNETGTLSSVRETASPIVYHNKDIAQRFLLRPGVFVHVPKTGGHVIETVLHYHHIESGRFADWHSPATAPYTEEHIGNLNGICKGKTHCDKMKMQGWWCSQHHRPPTNRVHGGLAVVRDPIDRSLSEFCYSLPWLKQWFQRTFEPSCNSMNVWVPFVLNKYKERAGVVLDCHMVPQWRYASKVDVIISYTELMVGNGWKHIREHFRLPEGTELPTDLDHQKAGSGVQTVCKRQVNRTCLSAANTQRLREFFREDYTNLARYFLS